MPPMHIAVMTADTQDSRAPMGCVRNRQRHSAPVAAGRTAVHVHVLILYRQSEWPLSVEGSRPVRRNSSYIVHVFVRIVCHCDDTRWISSSRDILSPFIFFGDTIIGSSEFL